MDLRYNTTVNLPLDSDDKTYDLETPAISIDSPNAELDDKDIEEAACVEPSKCSKNGVVTLDVTKALLLLGFTSWSAVEEGVEAGDTEQMKAKLSNIVKSLIKERQEYHALIEETKELNYELYKMMISAEENHNGALYKSNDVIPNCIDETSTSKTDTLKEQHTPSNKEVKRKISENNSSSSSEKDPHLRRTKSEKVRKRSFKKAGRVATATVKAKAIAAKDNKKVTEVDKESESLLWAERILIKEYNRRNELRKKSNLAVKKVNSKLETLNAFKHLLTVMKQDVSVKANVKDCIPATTNSFNSSEQKESSSTTENLLETKTSSTLSETSPAKNTEKSNETSNKDDPAKIKVRIVSLRDQIETKKMEAPDAATVLSYHKDKFQSTNEKDKIKEAKKFLSELRERIERNKRLSSGTMEEGNMKNFNVTLLYPID